MRDGLGNESQIKPLTELTILMACLLRTGLESLGGPARTILAWLVDVANSAPVRDQPVRTNNQLVLRAGMCAVVAVATGNRDIGHECAVQRALDAGLLDQSERHPHHVMIERMMLDLGGFRHGLPSYAELVGNSMAGRRPDALYQHTRSAYELTHDVMFGTALGNAGLEGMSAIDRNELGCVIGDLVVRYGRSGHWDLVGEFVMCWDFLELVPDDVYARAWRLLGLAQDSDGSVPGVRVDRDDGSEAEAPDKRFGSRYHTTLVVALAATASLRRVEPVSESCPILAPGPVKAPDGADLDTQWLIGLVDRVHESRKVTVGIEVLVGLTLVEARHPGKTNVDTVISGLRDCIVDVSQLRAVPAALTLLAHSICLRQGSEIPALSVFVGLITSIVTQPAPDEETELLWFDKRLLTAALGLSAMPAQPSVHALWAVLHDTAPEAMGSLVPLALACGGYGTRRPALLSSADQMGVRTLEAIAVEALWRSDLINGCGLIRAAHALSPLRHSRRKAISDFLDAQRLPDGGFGFVDYRAVTRSMGTDLDVELDLRLPTSLAVWWTLAEINGDFRLMGSPSNSGVGGIRR